MVRSPHQSRSSSWRRDEIDGAEEQNEANRTFNLEQEDNQQTASNNQLLLTQPITNFGPSSTQPTTQPCLRWQRSRVYGEKNRSPSIINRFPRKRVFFSSKNLFYPSVRRDLLRLIWRDYSPFFFKYLFKNIFVFALNRFSWNGQVSARTTTSRLKASKYSVKRIVWSCLHSFYFEV